MDKDIKKAINEYIKIFGTDDDINEYILTWDYDDNDFERLAGEIEDCVRKRKKYKNVYISFWQKLYYKTIYKILTKYIDDL